MAKPHEIVAYYCILVDLVLCLASSSFVVRLHSTLQILASTNGTAIGNSIFRSLTRVTHKHMHLIVVRSAHTAYTESAQKRKYNLLQAKSHCPTNTAFFFFLGEWSHFRAHTLTSIARSMLCTRTHSVFGRMQQANVPRVANWSICAVPKRTCINLEIRFFREFLVRSNLM